MTWALDLDGVVWLGESPIPGAAQAIARLRSSGTRVVFITNNSATVVTEVVRKLQLMDIPASDEDVVTSAQAAATLVKPGETALVCAGKGVDEALQYLQAQAGTQFDPDCIAAFAQDWSEVLEIRARFGDGVTA